MLHAYSLHSNHKGVIESVKCILTSGILENRSPDQVMERIVALVQDAKMYPKFQTFIHQMSQIDDTWKFWAQFVFSDCYCYVGLYLAIRDSNWKLRISSLKQMAPLFAAFDRDTYERIIPQHLADLQQYPSEILRCLETGGFTVNISGQKWHSVAFDEAHEMCINKDLKTAVVHPTKTYLQKTTLFFNYRIKAYKNLIRQLFPERFTQSTNSNTILDSTSQANHREENIQQMCSTISTCRLLPPQLQTNRELFNAFNGQQATPEQSSDMLTFCQIGIQAFKHCM